MIKGLISVGTNSTRALVADLGTEPPHPIAQLSIGTRLGEGLKESGRIAPEAMQRTLDAIAEHLRAIRRHTSDVQVIATSAVRRAENADVFARRVREIAGAELQIVSGEDEARYSYIGALLGMRSAAHERFAVADIGGGSTEYAAGTTKDNPERIVSCEIGAVRLSEAVPNLTGAHGPIEDADFQRACALAYKATTPIDAFEHPGRLVFVGGSATTTIALLRGSREPFEYAEVTRSDLRRTIQLLRERDLPARKALPGMNPQRADILLAGSIVLQSVFERAGCERATVSTNDILIGFLAFWVRA